MNGRKREGGFRGAGYILMLLNGYTMCPLCKNPSNCKFLTWVF